MTFNYKNYSLKKLEDWVHDCISAAEASPQEIYDVIKKTVEEYYYTYKHHTSRAYELLALLNGNGKGHIKAYDDYVDKVLSCDKEDPSLECKGAWNSFCEENYCPEEYGLQYTDEEIAAMCDAAEKQDKVKKWVLPVEMHPSGEYYVLFPDDLLEAANLTEGDQIEWVDNGDGSYTMKKIKK